MSLRSFLAAVTVAVLVLLGVLVWFLPSDEDFRVENPSWNGVSWLAGSGFTMVESLRELPGPAAGSTLVVVPYADFTPADVSRLEDYVRRGGRLVLADDFGFGNSLLEAMGIAARFSGVPLLDPLFSYRNPSLPRVTRFAADPLTDGLEELVLNHPTGIVGADGLVLATSSSFSFLDEDGDGGPDAGEPAGPVPVVVRQGLGSGEVLLVSDPSLFINSMTGLGDNRRFIENLGGVGGGGLFFDQSHLPDSELHRAKNSLEDIRGALMTPPGVVLLMVAIVAAGVVIAWYRKGGNIGKPA